MKRHALVLTIAICGSAGILATPALSDSVPLPAQESQGNIAYLSGGVGEDEADAMKRAAAEYPLGLEFVQKATPRNEFLADVKVRIRDRSNNVLLDTVSKGPFLLAKLPAGTYRVEADHGGTVKRQTVAVRPGKHERAVFVWAPTYESSGPVASSSSAEPGLPAPPQGVTGPAEGAPLAPLPATEIVGNIAFLSGGVGEDEAAAMKRAAADYPLVLEFVQKASPRDEFLADVKVRITDRSKNVLLDTVSKGPFLLAKLPPGTYHVEADHDGMVKRQTVSVRAGKRERAVFVWAPSHETRSMSDEPVASSN